MSDTTIDTKQISQRLLRNYTKQFVCTVETDMVVEGFPRSSNTFTVDFLNILAERAGRQLRFAHHTHDADNVVLGCRLNIPSVVLIREPLDAIASYMIYSGTDMRTAVARYVKFYDTVRPLKARVLVARFDVLVSDFNAFVTALNERFGFGLPLSEDPAADAEAAKEIERERGARMYTSEQYASRVAVPNEERRAQAERIKAELADWLEERPHSRNLYAHLTGS